MPDRSDKLLRLGEEADEYELPYVSKSRAMSWIKNPEHFRLKYLEGLREPETQAMRRGTDIHETFEHYYKTIQDVYDSPEDSLLTPPTSTEMVEWLPDDRRKWADYTEPYVSNFLQWEYERFTSCANAADYPPVGIETEHWRDSLLPSGEGSEWMGIADAIFHAGTLPSIESDEGVVIVDFKTGSVPDREYRDPGIYTELEYYSMLFEDRYNVAAAAAFYPKEGELLIKPNGDSYRDDVLNAVRNMLIASEEYNGSQKFEAKSGPLCGWSPDPEDRSSYYGICSQCTWNVPADNQNQFEQLVEEGYSDTEIAEHLGCEPGESSYWRYKLDL